MKIKQRYACLTFHTERLHDDKIWVLIKDMVRFLNSKNISATWFSIAPIHPVYSQFSFNKWSQRLKELSSKNQLLEQHTHFYKDTKGPYDLSQENLRKRLLEDKAWLESQGFEIKGFVGGGWTINKDLLKLLCQNDYLYDCTMTFNSHYTNLKEISFPVKFTLQSNSLVEIPTTSKVSLRSLSIISPLSRPQFIRYGNLEFCIIYLHDWDLIKVSKRISLKVILNILERKANFVTTRQLAKYLDSDHLLSVNLEKKQ